MSQIEFRVKVRLRATVSPSEAPLKVAAAVASVLGMSPDDVEVTGTSAQVRTDDPKVLARVRDKLRDRHVRSAARRQFILNKEGGSTSVMLNRQAAAAGVIALCGTPEESPLGPIYLKVESDRIDEAIDWLASYDEG